MAPTFRTGHVTADGTQLPFVFGISLPKHIIESWLFERKNIVKTAEQMKRALTDSEERRLAHLYSEKVERYLDAGHGSCFMKNDRVAELIMKALQHFDGRRYALAAWCVMPNHVHVVDS